MLTFCQNRIYCIHKNKTPPKKPSGMARPVGGGLSGEHIQLCAEGARRISPNLSGKWTETQDALFFAEQSLCRAAFLFFVRK